jgi:ubiquitin carboxyl-terminal hydrolase L5
MDSDDINMRVTELESLIVEEDRKRIGFRKENIRRKHNYLPFVIELLKVLAEEGKLVDLVNKAKVKQSERAVKKSKK